MLVLLCVMDGFGLREPTVDNAVAHAFKPVYDRLLETCLHTKLDGSGPAVGLPPGQMGNSEVGHLNLGAGRVLYQDITRIDQSITDGSFFSNVAFLSLIRSLRESGRALHLMGLCSNGQVHASLTHLSALLELAKLEGLGHVYLHAFTDGRDTPPHSGADFLEQIIAKMHDIGVGRIATVGGRYYGMDRDKRWERTTKHYKCIVNHASERHDDPVAALKHSYAAGVTDEFVLPFVVNQEVDTRLVDGDGVIFFNFRADRTRQLSRLLLNIHGQKEIDSYHPHVSLVTMTHYDDHFTAAQVAFPPHVPKQLLGEVIAKAGMKQLRCAETEKYPHVTFFFNGGQEEPFPGEDRFMAQSPKVATYDFQPEMSSIPLTDAVVERVRSGRNQFVLINYANADMVGHTGVFSAAKYAVEAVDRGLGRLLAAVREQKGVALITADHGNAEMMIDPNTGGPWTAHTTNLVPCIFYDPWNVSGVKELRSQGILADIAPTVLQLLKLPIPPEMTGQSLIAK